MAPAIQVIFNPQLQEFAAELFPGVGMDAGGGLTMCGVVDVAAILAGCTICESAADINPFLACPQADKLGRILHVYESLKVEPPDGVTSLSLVQAFAAAASALDPSDPLQEDLLLTSADFLPLEPFPAPATAHGHILSKCTMGSLGLVTGLDLAMFIAQVGTRHTLLVWVRVLSWCVGRASCTVFACSTTVFWQARLRFHRLRLYPWTSGGQPYLISGGDSTEVEMITQA